MKHFIFIILLLCSYASSKAQNEIMREVRTYMAKGNRFLENRDTLSAIEQYKKVLELNSDNDNIRNTLNKLEAEFNAPKSEEKVSLNRHAEESEVVVEDSVVGQDITKSEQATEIVSQPLENTYSGGGKSRFNRYINTNGGEVKKKVVKPVVKLASSGKGKVADDILPEPNNDELYSNDDDQLLQSLLSAKETDAVYTFYDSPVSAFAEKTKTKDSDTIQAGKWISSVYGGTVIPQQMLSFEYIKESRKLIVSEQLSALSRMIDNMGVKVQYEGNSDSHANISLDCKVEFDAKDRGEVERFITNALSPFFGKYHPLNLSVYRWMKAGTLTYDTIYNERIIHDTIEVINPQTKKMNIEVKDSLILTPVINSKYVCDDSYPLLLKIHTEAHPSKNLLSGTINVSVVLRRKNDEINIINGTFPCLWYNIDNEEYLAESAAYTPKLQEDPLEDFDITLRNLYLGRKQNKAESLCQSAIIMHNSTNPDTSTFDSWIGKAIEMGNSDAMIFLGIMKLTENNTSQEAEEVDMLLDKAWRADDSRAPFLEAVRFVNNGFMSQAFNCAKESANMNDANAMSMLSEMLFSGIGMKRNKERALWWLKRRDNLLRTIK